MVAVESVMFIVIVFTVAGWIKGVTGMGLPTVVMGALGLVMAPVQAAALLLVPSLVTNIWQFATGPARGAIFRRLLPLLLEKSLQAKFLVPMATSLGFGVIFSTFITLIIVPVLYSLLEESKNRMGLETDYSEAGGKYGKLPDYD